MNYENPIKPAGATHFGPACQHLSANWFRLDCGEWSLWSSGYGWTECRDGLQPLRLNTMVELKPPPWNGEGPPPIGKATCEYLGAHQYDLWTVVNIFAHWGDQVFVDYGDGWRAERDLKRFRPIRTPEQIAAEEREFEIIEIERVAMSGGSAKTMAEAIYDAGYRKFEITNEDREAMAKALYCAINWDDGERGWSRLIDARKDDYRKAVDEGWTVVPRA